MGDRTRKNANSFLKPKGCVRVRFRGSVLFHFVTSNMAATSVDAMDVEDKGKNEETAPALSQAQKQLYDRQIGAYGMKMMSKLVKKAVLIVGLRGLGVEIAKNVILAGPRKVTVADAGMVDAIDLSAQFYLR